MNVVVAVTNYYLMKIKRYHDTVHSISIGYGSKKF